MNKFKKFRKTTELYFGTEKYRLTRTNHLFETRAQDKQRDQFINEDRYKKIITLALQNGLKSFKTCDNYYEEGSSFDEVYSNIANEMIEEYKKYGELVYAVPGHPLVAERSVLNLINLTPNFSKHLASLLAGNTPSGPLSFE